MPAAITKSATLPIVLLVFGTFAMSVPALAQTDTSTPAAKSFDEAVDRAISNEQHLMATLRNRQPIVETYIQELKPDPEVGAVPDRDFYFLGKLDLSHGMTVDSFIPAGAMIKKRFHLFTATFNIWNTFFPSGFASRILIDEGFNRSTYSFEYVKREFLGEVRCIVIDVRPQPHIGKGRFQGRIWVEDRDYNIVRFNGSYTGGYGYLHFDSWRVNAGPNLWVPAAVYTEEDSYSSGMLKTSILRAQTRFWNFQSQKEQAEETFTDLVVDIPQGVKDRSEAAAETSPIEAQRMWQREAEDNVIERLQRAGLVAPVGEVESVLDTVLNNLEVTNNISLEPSVRVRIIPTTPLESISVGYTILVSRGLLDVLPDEACLAAVIARELANIMLGHSINTRFAFADQISFGDTDALKDVSLRKTDAEEEAADAKAIEILKNSPYKDKLGRVGLFLRMLSARSNEVPHLIQPLMGDGLARNRQNVRLAGLMEIAPELQMKSTDQVPALPLGSRISMDPWSDRLRLLKTRNVPLLSASEKRPFEISPIMLYLRREKEPAASNGAGPEASGPTDTAKR